MRVSRILHSKIRVHFSPREDTAGIRIPVPVYGTGIVRGLILIAYSPLVSYMEGEARPVRTLLLLLLRMEGEARPVDDEGEARSNYCTPCFSVY